MEAKIEFTEAANPFSNFRYGSRTNENYAVAWVSSYERKLVFYDGVLYDSNFLTGTSQPKFCCIFLNALLH